MHYDDSDIAAKYALSPVMLTAVLGEGGIRWGAALPLSLAPQRRQVTHAEGPTGASSDLQARETWLGGDVTHFAYSSPHCPKAEVQLVSALLPASSPNLIFSRHARYLQLNRRSRHGTQPLLGVTLAASVASEASSDSQTPNITLGLQHQSRLACFTANCRRDVPSITTFTIR